MYYLTHMQEGHCTKDGEKFSDLIDASRIASFDRETLKRYQKDMITVMDRKILDEELVARGLAQGRAEGRAEGEAKGKIETAKAMLENGLPEEMVIKCTGLSESQIAELA